MEGQEGEGPTACPLVCPFPSPSSVASCLSTAALADGRARRPGDVELASSSGSGARWHLWHPPPPPEAPGPGLTAAGPGCWRGHAEASMGPDALVCAVHGVSRRGFSHYVAVAQLWLWSPPQEADIWDPCSSSRWFSLKTQERSREGGTSLGLLHPTDLRGWVSASARRTAAAGSTAGPRAPAEASRAQWCGLGSLGVSGSVSSSGVRLVATARLCMASRWCCLALL